MGTIEPCPDYVVVVVFRVDIVLSFGTGVLPRGTIIGDFYMAAPCFCVIG